MKNFLKKPFEIIEKNSMKKKIHENEKFPYVSEKQQIISNKNLSNDYENIDYQGICWLLMINKTRSTYRALRNNQYRPYLSDNDFKNLMHYPLKKKQKSGKDFYKFLNFYQGLSPKIGHFQLRYNLEVASYHDIYFLSGDYVIHYCTIRNEKRKFLLPADCEPVCLSFLDDYFCLGDLTGKLYLFDVKEKRTIFYGSFLDNEERHIVNSAKIYKDRQMNTRILTASNDCKLRVLDIERILTPISSLQRLNPINFALASPDSSLIATYSDQKEAEIFDLNSGKLTYILNEHQDYGFCLDWHPNGIHLATGNQDTTCRVWDIRNTKTSLHVLPAEIGSVYNTKYSKDGRFLAFAEAIDYVNIYDSQKNYESFQQIDFFGENTGFGFNPEDSQYLFIGVNIKDFDGIFQFKRKNYKKNRSSELKNSFL